MNAHVHHGVWQGLNLQRVDESASNCPLGLPGVVHRRSNGRGLRIDTEGHLVE